MKAKALQETHKYGRRQVCLTITYLRPTTLIANCLPLTPKTVVNPPNCSLNVCKSEDWPKSSNILLICLSTFGENTRL